MSNLIMKTMIEAGIPMLLPDVLKTLDELGMDIAKIDLENDKRLYGKRADPNDKKVFAIDDYTALTQNSPGFSLNMIKKWVYNVSVLVTGDDILVLIKCNPTLGDVEMSFKRSEL